MGRRVAIGLATCLLVLGTSEPVLARDGASPDDFATEVEGAAAVSTPRAGSAEIANNPRRGEFMMVFAAEGISPGLADDEWEIYALRVARTGEALDSLVRVSYMGEDGFADGSAHSPAIAYNPSRDEYLVVWTGANYWPGLTSWDEFEVYGQRLSGEGVWLGDPIRISHMGPDGDQFYDALGATVEYNPVSNEYLVAWNGDDFTGAPGVFRETEVYVQRVGATGDLLGEETRVSFTGPDGDVDYRVSRPRVAVNPATGVHLVTWVSSRDDIPQGLESEVFGQFVTGAGVLEGGRLRLTFVGADPDHRHAIRGHDLVFSPFTGEFLLVYGVWDRDFRPLEVPEEIFAQRLSAAGVPLGVAVRVSLTGPDGDRDFVAANPNVIVSPQSGHYLITWVGDATAGLGHGGEEEIHYRAISPDGTAVASQVRLTHAGEDGDPEHDAYGGAIAVDPYSGLVLIPWSDGSLNGVLLREAARPRNGYWMLESGGQVHHFGEAFFHGSSPLAPAAAVDIASATTGYGYWVAREDGSVEAYGEALSIPGAPPWAFLPGERITTIAASPTGGGFWLFSDRGRATVRGDAPLYGDLAHLALAAPVIDSAPTPSGTGYWMLGADGGVFAFGDAEFYGSIPEVLPGVTLNAPIVGLVPTPTGRGYWMVASDGGVFAFGDAPYVGSIPEVLPGVALNAPIVGMVPYGDGYLMVASDGGVFNFSSKPFQGSLGDSSPPTPVVGIAPLDAR